MRTTKNRCTKKGKPMNIRHGDVIILPTSIPTDAAPKAGNVLAEGEATGHAHRITEGTATLFEKRGTLYLRVESEYAALTHEEHHRIDVPKGDWIISIQREYEPNGWREVAD
jgi:hypothetical protein